LDSCTKYQDYIDKAVADGCKAIAFTEQGNWRSSSGFILSHN
jgi:DNA polymerase III alpha subunit